MNIEFKYSVVLDLMYHILAHMKVENASDLYSEAYIGHMNEIKNGRFDSITEAASHLSDYYNENFGRLGVINFLPFVCSSVQDLINAAEHFDGFTEADKEEFIAPFNQLLKSEFEFYEDYWNTQFNTTAVFRNAFESWIRNQMGRFEALFSFFNKHAVVGMSYSLTSNGRGFEDASSFQAIVPFAFDESKYKNTFFQILHEYTHQFTDQLLGETIRMDDGTHDISEKAVILFDYYLIQKIDQDDTDLYLKWIGSLTDSDDCSEKIFLSAFKVNDDINEKLLELAERIGG